jgi:transglutaminase-like putative cysteine protease
MRRLPVVALLLCLSCGVVHADDTWMSVQLDGRKIGSLHVEREIDADRIITTQTLSFRLNRSGHDIPLMNISRSTESHDGQPLAFSNDSSMSARQNMVSGTRREDGNFQVTSDVGGQSRITLLAWPDGAMLAEAQRQAIRSHGWRPGARYRLLNFDPASQQTVDTEIAVVGDERVDLPNGAETLHHLQQSLHMARGTQVMDLWVNDEGRVRRGMMPLLGFHLEMLACDQACALAPDQNIDLLRVAMTGAPRPLTPNLRAEPLRYLIRVDGNSTQPFIDTDEQRSYALGDGLWILDVGATRRSGEATPSADDVASTAWLQSESPVLRDMASKVVGDADNDLQKMRRLRSFVSSFIQQKGLNVGYASALETVETRAGDCTEHAVLLAALARAEGIPARVVTGIVYSDRFAGASRVFVPHAWMQAWINGRWRSFDAALGRFDSTHIALGVGSGDPWKFFAGLGVLGNMTIELATPLSSLIELPGAGGVSSAGTRGP